MFHCRVKYTGLLGLGCVGLLTICDLWQLVADPTLDMVRCCWKTACAKIDKVPK